MPACPCSLMNPIGVPASRLITAGSLEQGAFPRPTTSGFTQSQLQSRYDPERSSCRPGTAELRAAQEYDLRVLEVVVENRGIEPDLAVEQIGLQSQLVGSELLRAESARLRGIERTRTHAARLVAGADGSVGHHLRIEAVVGTDVVVGAAALEDVRAASERTAPINELVDRDAVEVVPIVGIALVVLRVAQTTRHGKRVGGVPGQRAECGL